MAIKTLIDGIYLCGRDNKGRRCVVCTADTEDEIFGLMNYYYMDAEFKFKVSSGWWWWCHQYLFVCHY